MSLLVPEVTRTTYGAAHAHFDAAPLGFWSRAGEGTVARLGLHPGAAVLDLCCGTGASAVPAARAVGPMGSVLGVDISKPLLDIARSKAQSERLAHVRFIEADMTELAFPEESFDAILVVFGIFFAPDMVAQVRALARMLRPGGVVAVTTWGACMFEPLYSVFLESVRAERAWPAEYRPWDRLTTPEEVYELMSSAGLSNATVELEASVETITTPEDWWNIVLGTGLRWFTDQLEPETAERVRQTNLACALGVPAVETNIIYALARK
jgi:SAM-dependent methyltransferase